MNHTNCTSPLSAGAKALPDGVQAFAHTQAMWRFLANPRVSPKELAVPLLKAAHEAVAEQVGESVLCIHDWSRLNYRCHEAKQDRLQMTHKNDVGYELQSSLLVSAADGAPLAVPAQNLVTAQGLWRCRDETISAGGQTHLDELSERMDWLEAQQFGKRLVHIIDREADSAAHMRRWSAQGQHWLVRVKAGSSVQFGKRSMSVKEVAKQLTFREARQVQCKGQPAIQWIASAPVVLTRKAKPTRCAPSGRRVAPIAGEPLALRMVVSRLYDVQGRLVAEWYLLSALPETVSDAQIALWYYFRWQIESFFKLLKQAGHHLEDWEQESGRAIFKRLLIASHACLLVWRLAREHGEAAEQSRAFLVRLSGRQMKASRPITMPALLDGAFKLFAMLEALQHYSPAELRGFADSILHGARSEKGKHHV
ncbi:MAG: transposase [Rhodocyclales bacterium]|nr:transposase [Rhodocyclales bacterium]